MKTRIEIVIEKKTKNETDMIAETGTEHKMDKKMETKIHKKSLWKSIITTAKHDALRYKKANKKKCDVLNNSVKRTITALGVATLVLLMVGSAFGAMSENIEANEVKLTSNGAHDRQASWSPDGQWITFVSTRSGSWDVYKMSKNGETSGLVKLTTYGGFDLEPSWGKNGKIVFSAGSGQGYEDIYTMNNDGTNRQRLTSTIDFDEYPDWNPDATKIVYSSVNGIVGGAKQIWIMNADGSNKHRINNAYGIQPAWSPDGTKIAFKCYINGYNVCVMNADGTNLRQLTSGGGNNHDPDWSPDSTKLVYASNKDGDWELYIMNADGTDKRQLTSNTGIDDNYPSWSPDGSKIIFSSTRSGNDEIWSISPSTSVSTGIAVVSPNGGETWTRGTTKVISWTSSGNPGTYVKIELLKNGVSNRVINSYASNGGSYSWTIPLTQTAGGDYKIRIVSASNSVYSDTSDDNFIIG